MSKKRIAVVLFNLGGPDKPEAIRPFLRNLFRDERIIGAPKPIREMLAWFISSTRAPKVKPLYAEMGGASPILPNTQAQAIALEAALNAEGAHTYKVYLAMRYWHPFTQETIQNIIAEGTDEVVLLPLYPQFSTTTTESSMVEWQHQAEKAGLRVSTHRIGCYPLAEGFVQAEAELIQPLWQKALQDHPNTRPMLLFSAHGLPKKIITDKGDPYVWQIEQTATAVAEKLSLDPANWGVSYQSRVGPVEWVGPYTDQEIRRMGGEGRPLVIVPIAFVSEHIETLVELDIENKHLAMESGCPGYYRVPTVSTHPAFIAALAAEVRKARQALPKRLCPPEFNACACAKITAESQQKDAA